MMNHLLDKTNKRLKLLSKLSKGFAVYNFPQFFENKLPENVLIALTYQCNSRCIMCNIWKMKPKNELSYEEWSKMVSDPLFSEVKTLDITGGEALLHPNFIRLIKLFVTAMPKVTEISVVTNGFATTIIKKQITQLISFLKPRHISLHISISLDGLGDTHEQIRHIPDAFNKVTKTIFMLKKIQDDGKFLTMSVGSLLLKQNIHLADKVAKWLSDNDIKYGFQIVGFHDTYVRNLDTADHVNFSKTGESTLIKLLDKLSRPTSWRDVRAYYWRDLLAMYRDHKPRTTPCPFQHDQLAIDSLGYIYNCFSTSAIGNVRDGKSPSKLYFSKENLHKKRHLISTACTTCNSGCNANLATAKDMKHYLYFRLTGKPYYG